MKDLLQGKPLRHPLHPFLVHFPIGLFTMSLVLDVAARIWPDAKGLSDGAWYTMAAGVVMGLFAAVPGFVDYTGIRQDHPARKIATAHMLLNLFVVSLYAVNLGIREYEARQNTASSMPLLLAVGAFLLLALSGHLGGKLVFDNGISVGRHRRKTRTPDKTRRISSAAERVVVGKADELRDGETLRVDVNGTVLVLLRAGDDVHALQEFCTHRFGPLSEGCVRNGEIECPWHRSRFNVKTGEVTHGPAKVNLKSYTVQIVNGDLLLQLPPSS